MVEILDSAEGEADRWVSEREDELMTEAHAEPWQHDREEILQLQADLWTNEGDHKSFVISRPMIIR